MAISISISATHPDVACPQNNKGTYSDIICMQGIETLPQAQDELDQRAALSKLLCKSCGGILTSPMAALDM